MTLPEFSAEFERQYGYPPVHPARIQLDDGRWMVTHTCTTTKGHVTRLDEPVVVDLSASKPHTAGKLRYS